MVDNPLDEGQHQELVVAKILDFFWDRKGNVGVVGSSGIPWKGTEAEENISGDDMEIWGRNKQKQQWKAAMADCCVLFQQ